VHQLIEVESCSSTNDLAFEHLHRLTRMAVWSTHQTSGRGSRGKAWSTPKGAGLAISIGLRGSDAPDPREFAYPLYAGVIAGQVLTQQLGIPLRLKWPNDILCSELKLCGILCESRWQHGPPKIVVGLGINLRPHSDIHRLNRHYVSLAEVATAVPDPRHLTRCIVDRFFDQLWRYQERDHLHRQWLSMAELSSNREVEIHRDGQVHSGRFKGLDATGNLQIKLNSGRIFTIQQSSTDLSLKLRSQ